MGGKRGVRHCTDMAMSPVDGLPTWAPMAAWLEVTEPRLGDEDICTRVGLARGSRSALSRIRQDERYQTLKLRAFMATVGATIALAIGYQRDALPTMDAGERTDLIRALAPLAAKAMPAQVSLDADIDVGVSGGLRLDLATATQADMLRELARLAREDPAVRAVLAAEDSAE